MSSAPAPAPPAPSPTTPELNSNPGPHAANLGLCQGDCDSDGDCIAGLRCSKRTGLEAVPGCNGAGVLSYDYCYDPAAAGGTVTPWLDSSPGQHGEGQHGQHLQLCQGDCDTDGDCQGELRCFKRKGLESVPGCLGHGLSNFDYCMSG